MNTISSATGPNRRSIDDDNQTQHAPEPQKREVDPNLLSTVQRPASDMATIARNLAARGAGVVQHELETMGREKITSSASTSHAYASEADARAAFATQSKKLADVSQWTTLSGRENANFDLFDRSGAAVSGRSAAVGDFVRVQLPGQKQYDWVRVEDVSVTADRVGVRVRPTYDPTKHPLTPDVVAHFFTRETTNTFLIERNGTSVTARVEGRDESANVGPRAGGLENAVRNRAACEGAWGVRRSIPGTNLQVNGLQQHQWNVFTENLVKP